MFNKILIANRGEIALRILRACKEMDIKTVAVYSEADRESLHALMADEAILIGEAPANKSYLDMNKIIEVALALKVDAIHPGYGFLAENADFAALCEKSNIKFIGPREEHILKMGNKSEARKTMIEAGVPVVPGSEGSTNQAGEAFEVAKKIGFPVIVKASSGGGGRGMRIVYNENVFVKEFNMAKTESQLAFNDDSMYVEKFVEEPRHIEFQILADEHSNVIHLGERDCSIQRRNQKVLEESPCQVMSEATRKKMGEAAIRAAKAVDYINAGTIEFLLDKNQDFYFIEMNTRIQVEHPVTEMVTNVDLIKEQIKIAAGEKLQLKQKDISVEGHAIECRINAEDCVNNFMPSPGKIDKFFLPGGYGIRVDSHIYNGYFIPPNYDSMIGKLIVWGEDREEAILRMKRVLNEIVITGIKTNIDFQLDILENESFTENKITTGFINDKLLKDIS